MPTFQYVRPSPEFAKCPVNLIMSSRANSCNASKAIQTVDDVDLPYDCKPNLRAILLPTSESAIYSTHLQVNNGVVCSIKKSIPLLSPCASSSEDEGSTSLTSKDHTHNRRIKKGLRLVRHWIMKWFSSIPLQPTRSAATSTLFTPSCIQTWTETL
jgi:hypothetical protein